MFRKVFTFFFYIGVLIGCGSQSPATKTPIATVPPIATTVSSPTETAVSSTTTQEVTNLVAFSRLYGLVRYFHPSDQVAAMKQWDVFVIDGIEAVRDARTADELAQQLNAYFAPIAPTVLVTVGDGEETAVSPPHNTDQDQLIMWQHYGVAADNTYQLYTSERLLSSATDTSLQFHDPAQPYRQPLGAGLTAYVPLTLFVSNGQTQPVLPDPERPNNIPSPDTNTSYIASAIMFWAVTQHFYPYFDVVDADWDNALNQAITNMLTSDELTAWEKALEQLVAELDDGHSGFKSQNSIYAPFVSLGWIDEQVVVLDAIGTADEVMQTGDIILEVDGESAVTRLQETMSLVSGATPQFKRYRSLSLLLGGQAFTSVSLKIEKADGSQEEITTERSMLVYNGFQPDILPNNFTELEPDIFYVNLSQSNRDTFEDDLLALGHIEGIIFDLRGYPSVNPGFLELFITDTISTAQFLVPQTSTPNQEDVTFLEGGWTLQPRPDAPLTQNIIFLTDGRAISYSETLLAMIKHYQVGEILGEATAGTNGNINQIQVPSGHLLKWTGMLVLNQDGSQHHGIGVQPTIPISQTLDDLQNGIDTQLQAALQWIKDNQ